MAVTRKNAIIPPGMVDIVVSLKRGNLVKGFSLVVVLAICEYRTSALGSQVLARTFTCKLGLITLILLLVMLTCVFFGFRQKGEVLVVPVATLFAFTQLRQSMPGAPAGFGMYH